MRKKRTVITEQDALYYEAIFALFQREKTIKIVSKNPLLLEISGEVWNKSRMADMLVVFAQQPTSLKKNGIGIASTEC